MIYSDLGNLHMTGSIWLAAAYMYQENQTGPQSHTLFYAREIQEY